LIDKKADIVNSGREMFRSKGFKDTSVAEIAKMAGIATGTFYNYFSSKDILFMEIYVEENTKLKKDILKAINLGNNPLEVIKELMFLNYEGMISNPILKEWYNKDIFNKIEQSFREEKGLGEVDFLYDSFLEIFKKWQSEGQIRNDIDAEMIMAIFNTLIVAETHKEEIGVRYFPQVLEHMMEFIMKGLMISKL
jgi:AcrR family transcriptional regulator